MPNIKALVPVVSDKKSVFHAFPISVCAKHVTLGAGLFLAPGA